MHVVALLPNALLAHLRVVLGETHSLAAPADPGALHAQLRAGPVDLLVVDPSMREGRLATEIEQIVASHPSLPVIVYTALTPSAMRHAVQLARFGVQHVVLNRFDDEPRRFLDLIERLPAHPLAELMLHELEGPLAAMPVVVARAVEQLFRAPARVRNNQDLAALAGMIPRTLYRQLDPVGLQPRHLIICSRLLRAYTMLQESGTRLKEVATRLGYADPDQMTEQLRQWTGRTPKEIRTELSPAAFVQLLAAHLLRPHDEDELLLAADDAAEPAGPV